MTSLTGAQTNHHKFIQNLKSKDKEIFDVIQGESDRQEKGLELIASENYVSSAVMEAQGSLLTNKYAEGYPGKRYYGGCERVDVAERLALERVCKLFGAEAANVQPHSGSQANMAAYFSLIKPGEKILGMSLSHGGHLTHGSPVNFSGRLFPVVSYGLHEKTETLDYGQIRELAKKEKPALIVAGASAYPRVIDFDVFRSVADEVGAKLVVDMAHIAGLVAAGLHPSPIPFAHLTTSTTHKTLRGPRGGLILGSSDAIKAANSQIFPGIQGGPLMHVIAAKAVAFGEALESDFKEYQKAVVENAKVLAEHLMASGLRLVTGGTDNHLMLVDLTTWLDGSVSGKDAETWLDHASITVNKNTVPGEKRSPFVTSGIRIGTPAMTTRGLRKSEMKLVAGWIGKVLSSRGNLEVLHQVKGEVEEMCSGFPLYR